MPSRRLAVGLWLVMVAICAVQAARTRFVADLSLFLPEAPTEEQRLLVDQLREGAVTRVVLVGIEGADAATRARASSEMRTALAADPRFVLVANGQATALGTERELLLSNRYALSPNVDAARFTVEGLRAAVDDTLDLLASPAGMLVKPLVTRDPTGEMLAVLERLRPEAGPALAEGVWASGDGARALLLARTRASGADTDGQASALAAIESAFAHAAQGTSLALETTGPAAFAVRSRALIIRDVERVALAGLALVATILLVAYRSPLALGLGMVPVLSGALAGVAAVSLAFGTVHGITLGFGATLIGEAVDYSIYLFVQSGRARHFWPTVRLGVLTSIAGFTALLFSGLPGLAQLGAFSITGLVAAALATRFVMPALLPAGFQVRDLAGAGARLRGITDRLRRGRWIAPTLAIAAAVVIGVHRDRLWDPDLASLNPISKRDRQLDAALRADLGASDARVMVALRGTSLEEALARAEAAGERLDGLVASGALAGYESPARILPSAATQARRIASLPPAAELRARLARALAGAPLAAAKLEPFITDVEAARTRAPLTREALAGTALDASLDGLLLRDAAGGWTALLGLRAAGNAGIDAAAVRAALAGSPALVIDLRAELDRLYGGYFDRALAMSGVGLAAIIALLFGSLGDWRRVARVLAPLAVAVLATAAWHAATGTRMSLLHLVGLLLVVAIGSNYALFFDRIGDARDADANRTLASIALANATTVASFCVLAVSEIPVLRALGSTVAIGAFLALACAAMLARAGVTMPAGGKNNADDHRYRA